MFVNFQNSWLLVLWCGASAFGHFYDVLCDSGAPLKMAVPQLLNMFPEGSAVQKCFGVAVPRALNTNPMLLLAGDVPGNVQEC